MFGSRLHCGVGIAFLLWVGAGAMAQPLTTTLRRTPIVVAAYGNTVASGPFLQGLGGPASGFVLPGEVPPPPARPPTFTLDQPLPLVPTQLRAGHPTVREVEGLVMPVFVMGMDRLSLDWFERHATELARRGAQGVVVQASSAAQWEMLEAQAAEWHVPLHLMPDAVMVEGYGISTYPVVLTDNATRRSVTGAQQR